MAQIRWKRAIDGNFEKAFDWHGGAVPGPGNAAVLSAPGASFTVKATQRIWVKSIQTSANATLSIIHSVFKARQGTGSGTNAGTIVVGDRATFAVGGTVDNTGAIILDAGDGARLYRGATVLDLKRDTILTGGGSIVLSNNGYNRIKGHDVTLTNFDNTISGSGAFGYDAGRAPRSHLDIVNDAAGVIDADGSQGITLNGARVGDSSKLINDGLLEATKGGLHVNYMSVTGVGTVFAGAGAEVSVYRCGLSGQGLEVADDGNIVIQGGSGTVKTLDIATQGTIGFFRGEIAVSGTITNDGVLDIAQDFTAERSVTGSGDVVVSDGTADFASGFTQDIDLSPTEGSRPVVELGRSREYRGRISGFSSVSALDLDDIGFVGAREASFSGTGASGVLTVTDGTHTAHLKLVGDYTASTFLASSDGHGGVTVVESGGPQSHAFVAAMAGMAATPTATAGASGPVLHNMPLTLARAAY